MATLAKDNVERRTLVTEIPVTDVLKDSGKRRADTDFKVAIAIILGAWVVLIALIYSLREFNV